MSRTTPILCGLPVLLIFGALPYLLSAQTPVPVITSVAPADDPTLPLAPTELALVGGTGFGTQPTLTLNGSPVRISDSVGTLIYFQVPANLQPGSYTVVVTTSGGTSNSVNVKVVPIQPNIATKLLQIPGASFQSPPGVVVTPGTPVMPGDRARFFASGMGSIVPPPSAPQLLIDGQPVPILSYQLFQFIFGPPGALTVPVTAIDFQVPALATGSHGVSITFGGILSNVEKLPVLSNGIILSQTGLTFNAVQGGPAPAAQSVTILSGVGTINFSVSTSTFSGGPWLSATPAAGTVQFGQPGVVIQASANPAGLSAGTYYGQIQITSPDAKNSPQALTIVLVVATPGTNPGAGVSPTGLVFTGVVKGADPPPQSVNVNNPTAAPISFSASISPPNPFKVTPSSGVIAPGQTVQLSVQGTIGARTADVYSNVMTLTFTPGLARNIALILIVAPASTINGLEAQAPSGCKASKLLPVFTLLGDNFNVPAAWPTPVEVTIADDCGSSFTAGTTTLAFSNGDPPLTMTSLLNGKWTATWPPVNPRSSNTVISVKSIQQETGISGTAIITGGVQPNAAVPVINHGGVVETGSYTAGPAGGGLVAIFGAQLSDGPAQAMSLPLGTQLLTTSALIAGQSIPLVFSSSGQVNALLPYSLPTDTRQQLVISRANNYSVPEFVTIGAARPAVFTVDSSGHGQGHIYKIGTDGSQTLASPENPAKAGDFLVIYCAGLGAVSPPVDAGLATPFDHLTNTANPVTVTIGLQTIKALFAGLTPGFTGLYQVNVQVPPGLIDNDAIQLSLNVANQVSVDVTLAIRNSQ